MKWVEMVCVRDVNERGSALLTKNAIYRVKVPADGYGLIVEQDDRGEARRTAADALRPHTDGVKLALKVTAGLIALALVLKALAHASNALWAYHP